jgi:hypothetical protein
MANKLGVFRNGDCRHWSASPLVLGGHETYFCFIIAHDDYGMSVSTNKPRHNPICIF